MSLIVNPTATIGLGAPLPSQPNKMAAYQLPADPTTQGVARFDENGLGIVVWVLTMQALRAAQLIDRLERIVSALDDRTADPFELAGLSASLVAEVRARREAEAQAAAAAMAKEGAH